jgi:hypothetical protein
MRHKALSLFPSTEKQGEWISDTYPGAGTLDDYEKTKYIGD